MPRPEPKIKMTLGRELASEPPMGSAIITEKEGYLWAWHRTGSGTAPQRWVAASVKDARFSDWRDLKAKHRILVAFEIKR